MQVNARVAGGARGVLTVWTGGTERPVFSRFPAVAGDWVRINGDRVTEVLPRRNQWSRKRPGRREVEQVLAANVDVLLVVTGLDGDFNVRRLERYLVAAAASELRPVIVLNKSDLCPAAGAALDATRALGSDVVLTSAVARAGLDELERRIHAGETAVLTGSSGAGKSTILNALLGRDEQAVRPVRPDDSRGRHTTTSRELFRMPGGWFLIDTPGLRELQPWDAEAGMSAAFADIEALAANCRFRNCRHAGEPGCAVAGAVDPLRLRNYRNIKRD